MATVLSNLVKLDVTLPEKNPFASYCPPVIDRMFVSPPNSNGNPNLQCGRLGGVSFGRLQELAGFMRVEPSRMD